MTALRTAIAQFHHRRVRGEFVRFAAVGVANTGLSVIVFCILAGIGIWYPVAAPIAYGASLVSGYLLNRAWTFDAHDSRQARGLYVAVQAGGSGAMSGLTMLLVDVVGLELLPGFLVAAVPVTLCTFMANRFWTFAARR